MHVALWIGLALVALVAISMVVEAARRTPTPPARLAWGPAIPILYPAI